MQHLEGSGTPILYIQDARFLKVKVFLVSEYSRNLYRRTTTCLVKTFYSLFETASFVMSLQNLHWGSGKSTSRHDILFFFILFQYCSHQHTDHPSYLFPLYRVIKNVCRGFNNLSYTIHLRQDYVVAPMDQEILRVCFYDVQCFWSVVLLSKKYIYSYLKCIVYDKLLKPRQSFRITLYFLTKIV